MDDPRMPLVLFYGWPKLIWLQIKKSIGFLFS